MADEQQILSPEEQIAQLQAKVEELTNNWKRTSADFENYRKHKEQELKEIAKFAKEFTILELVPTLMSLEQILKYAPTDEKYKDWMNGLKVTIQQLEKTMEGMGVFKIKTVGEKFDPTKHEAMEQVEGEKEGLIVKELYPGFLMDNKVIIPAKVAVGKEVISNN
jgi:molecular chaperone GrpE